MKYLFLHIGQEWTGSARAFAAAARGLAARGHEVHVVVEPESSVEQVVSQMAVASRNKPLFNLESISLRGNVILRAFKLKRLIKANGINVVFVHSNREHLIAGLACRLTGRARVVRRMSAGQSISKVRRQRLALRMGTWLAPTAFMFTSDPDTRATIVPRRVVAKVVVPIGINLDNPANYDTAPIDTRLQYIVCVHDGSSRSRAATAIRTLAMLVPRHPKLRLIVMGEGVYDDDLRMQAAALRVLNLVTFLGDRDDSLHVMRNARLGWVVADSDTAAFALLDFMALEVPVLAGEHTVAERYVLPGITGMLLPQDDAHIIAATVADLLADEGTRTTMGEAARARVERDFSETAMLDGFESVAQRVVESQRR